MPRSRPLACAVAVLALAPAAQAEAAPPAVGQFGITPARRDVVAQPSVALEPTRVFNTTARRFRVTVTPVLLRQRLDGGFDFPLTKSALRTARTILRVQTRSFTLAPGQSRLVGLRWALLPRGTRAAAVGVIFQGVPPRTTAGAVREVDRLVSTNFLRLPGPSAVRGRLESLRAMQARRHVLRFVTRVHNTAGIVGTPRSARLRIYDRRGRRILQRTWRGDVVLAGARREFGIDVRSRLPRGIYRAVSSARFGRSRHLRAVTHFRLTGANALPTPRLRVDGVRAQAEVGRTARLSLALTSAGTASASSAIRVRLYRVEGGTARPVGAERVARVARLAPRARRTVEIDLGRVRAGSYRAVTTFTEAPGSVRQLATDFAPVRHLGLGTRAARWVRANGVLVGGALALFAMGVGLGRRVRPARPVPRPSPR